MAKVVLGVVLGLAGASLLIVSIWLLVDTKISKFPGSRIDSGHSPKIGAAAAGLLIFCSILCFAINKVTLRRSLILTGVLIAFILTVTCCGLATKSRLEAKQKEDATKEYMRRHGNHKYQSQIEETFSKLKSQLVVMAVIAGLDAFVEIVAMITAYRWKEGYP